MAAAPGSIRRRRGPSRRSRTVYPLLWVAAALGMVGPAGALGLAGGPGLSVAVAPGYQYPSTCPFNASDTEASRDVNLAPPSFPLAVGDAMTVEYEFAIHNVTHRVASLELTVPSFTAKFALTNGTNLTFFLLPRAIFLNGTAWSNASLATRTKTATQATHFASTSAQMSSELVAIMGNASYQTVTIDFRWHWSVTFAANGTTVTSPWSRVRAGGPHPTTFYPAPYVKLVGTTNRTVPVGSVFTANLTGAVTGTLFHSILEYGSNGRLLRNDETIVPASATPPVGVHVLIIPYRQALGPSLLLDHVRDYCLSLLYSISLRTVYAPVANVTVRAFPSVCGPVELNGTWYSSGSVVRLSPSATALPIAAGSCAGRTFQHWGRADGVWVANDTLVRSSAVVSAWGNLTAAFA